MLQMIRSTRHAHLMMLARTEDSLAVLRRHRTADHGHCLSDLHDLAVDADCGACGGCQKTDGKAREVKEWSGVEWK